MRLVTLWLRIDQSKSNKNLPIGFSIRAADGLDVLRTNRRANTPRPFDLIVLACSSEATLGVGAPILGRVTSSFWCFARSSADQSDLHLLVALGDVQGAGITEVQESLLAHGRLAQLVRIPSLINYLHISFSIRPTHWIVWTLTYLATDALGFIIIVDLAMRAKGTIHRGAGVDDWRTEAGAIPRANYGDYSPLLAAGSLQFAFVAISYQMVSVVKGCKFLTYTARNCA